MCLRGSVFSVCSFCCNHLCESCFQVIQRFVDVFHFCVDACPLCDRNCCWVHQNLFQFLVSLFSKTFVYSIELDLFGFSGLSLPCIPQMGDFSYLVAPSYRRQLTAPVIRVVDEGGTFVLSDLPLYSLGTASVWVTPPDGFEPSTDCLEAVALSS